MKCKVSFSLKINKIKLRKSSAIIFLGAFRVKLSCPYVIITLVLKNRYMQMPSKFYGLKHFGFKNSRTLRLANASHLQRELVASPFLVNLASTYTDQFHELRTCSFCYGFYVTFNISVIW